MYRFTLMPKIVYSAANIVSLVDGYLKAKTLQQVLQGEYKPSEFPSQIIKPENGELHWFVDEAAAQDLHSF